jgi:Sulfate permease family
LNFAKERGQDDPPLTLTSIVFTDAILIARTFAGKHGEKVDPNGELIGLEVANITSAFIQGFPVAASQSRTIIEVLSLLILNQEVEFPLKHLFKQVSLPISMFQFIVEVGESASP